MARFETTSWSLVLQARGGDDTPARAALEGLCEIYWVPLHEFVGRLGYPADEASDLVQGYFALFLEKQYLDDADLHGGFFRSFLLASLKHYVYNEYDKTQTLRRGGGVQRISIDTETADRRRSVEPVDARTPEQAYERSWAMTVVDRVLARLEAEQERAGTSKRFRRLKGYLTGVGATTPYSEAAGDLEVSFPAVKVAVHRLRARFGALLREEIARTVTDLDQVNDEIRHSLDVLISSGGREPVTFSADPFLPG